MASKLVELLKGHNVKFYQTPDKGIGVYKGQLYHLIREAKSLSDYEPENLLMDPLMRLILGEGKVHLSTHNNRDYYFASKADWEKALGGSIQVTEIQ